MTAPTSKYYVVENKYGTGHLVVTYNTWHKLYQHAKIAYRTDDYKDALARRAELSAKLRAER